METLTINGLSQSIAYCEAQGLAKCFQAYANNSLNEYIFEIGFNENTGYTYIALENGVTICSMLGNDIEYLVTDFDNGNEFFYSSHDEAMKHFETINA
jgi:hypothetical protein